MTRIPVWGCLFERHSIDPHTYLGEGLPLPPELAYKSGKEEGGEGTYVGGGRHVAQYETTARRSGCDDDRDVQFSWNLFGQFLEELLGQKIMGIPWDFCLGSHLALEYQKV